MIQMTTRNRLANTGKGQTIIFYFNIGSKLCNGFTLWIDLNPQYAPMDEWLMRQISRKWIKSKSFILRARQLRTDCLLLCVILYNNSEPTTNNWNLKVLWKPQ